MKKYIIITAIIIFVIASTITVLILSMSMKNNTAKPTQIPVSELREKSRQAYESGNVTEAKALLGTAKSQLDPIKDKADINDIEITLKLIELSGKKDNPSEPVILINNI